MNSGTTATDTTSNKHETLINAGKQVDQVVIRDQDQPDLLNILSSQAPTNYVDPLLGSAQDFFKINEIQVPPKFREAIEGTTYRCFAGVFPEIGRAWITVDSNLYIWNYTDLNDTYEYVDQDQIIIAVQTVKPKRDVFSAHISNIMIISTPLQIIVLAVQVKPVGIPNTNDSLTLYATDMSLSCDDVQMKTIVGTDDGRIFMVGHTGDVYELLYHQPSKWSLSGHNSELRNLTQPYYTQYLPSILRPNPSAGVSHITVDNERKIMYMLCERSVIQVVYLGDPSNDFKPIFRYTSISNDAIGFCRQQGRMFPPTEFDVDSLHVISQTESKKVHLMAMTTHGFRLYFTTYRDGFRPISIQCVPSTLELGHVIIPPNEKLYIPGQPNSSFCKTYYDCGICMSVRKKGEDAYSLFVTSSTSPPVPSSSSNSNNNTTNSMSQMTSYSMSNNSFASRPSYTETVDMVDVDANIIKLTEINQAEAGKRYLKEISQQLSDPPRQFIALAAKTLYFYTKLRPVDVLYHILYKQGSAEETTKEIQLFFERYGRIEACAMCLSVVCASEDEEVSRKATDLFFENGGLPTSTQPTTVIGNHLGNPLGQFGINFSGKHDGFVLYFSRLVSPVWNEKIFSTEIVNYSRTQNSLFNAKINLERLKQWMQMNGSFHAPPDIKDPRFQAVDRDTLQMHLREQNSVHELYLLLIQCIEAISFIEFLIDSDIQTILSKFATSDLLKTRASDLDMSTMLTTLEGRTIARELVLATIMKYGSTHTHAGFDIVSKQIERHGSVFFGASDIAFFKGFEHVRYAVYSESEHDRRQSLSQSLLQFKIAAADISEEMMVAISTFYKTLGYHVGVIELAFERAQRKDPRDQALQVYDAPTTPNETAHKLFEERRKAYQLIFHALEDVNVYKTSPQPPGRTIITEPDIYINHVYDVAISSRDRLFHYCLYTWYLGKNNESDLLDFDTPYLVEFFETRVADIKAANEFLWQYYRKHEEHIQCARCLVQLAEFATDTISLEGRIRYLSQAETCLRCDPQQRYTQDARFLKEKLVLAGVQHRAQRIVRGMDTIESKAAAVMLDYKLFTLTELREQFGNRFHELDDVLRVD